MVLRDHDPNRDLVHGVRFLGRIFHWTRLTALRHEGEQEAMVEGSAKLVVSVHDVAPGSAEETARWCADADSLGIPVALLVIPGRWRGMALADTPDYAATLRARQERGDEIVLHGWEHVAGPEGSGLRRAVGRAVARGAAEFAALDETEATRRLESGIRVLDAHGLNARGFTPPGWLASPAAERSLTRAGFTHTTSHFGVKDLRTGRLHRGFAYSHRPGGGAGEWIGAELLARGAARAARRGGLVRIALHPDDLRGPRLRGVTLRAIETVLAAGAAATTYAEVVAGDAE
jgi:predicted deacetylase